MNKFNKNFAKILESYGSINLKQRMLYPRNLKLSESFVKSFEEEFQRLVSEGNCPKKILEKMQKALRFHAKV